jgi:thiamine pyrophosphate-dependent acetolactate synthase large subunit-like protein
VFLLVPEDLQHAHLPEPLSFTRTAEPVAPAMDAAAARVAVDLFTPGENSRRPGRYWGRLAGAREEVRELAEHLLLPVAVSYTAKGVFPENDPLALGCLGFGSRPTRVNFFQDADLILAVGATFSEGTTIALRSRKSFLRTPRSCKSTSIPMSSAVIIRRRCRSKLMQKLHCVAIIDEVKKRQSKPTDNGSRAEAIKQAKEAWKNDVET